MIDLKLNIQGTFQDSTPFVIKLKKGNKDGHSQKHIGSFSKKGKDIIVSSGKGNFGFSLTNDEGVEDDICIVFPETKTLFRQIRANSHSNTILLTEQCDQACIMCSQPPKNKIYDYYRLYREALLLAPNESVIGITGGEPTLEKEHLFPFLLDVLNERPDLKFHILSNAQHFLNEDIEMLDKMNSSILWGIPVYSHDPQIHDEVVGKQGAYKQLLSGLNVLFKSGASVEIRTVVLEQNFNDLPLIAEFISKHASLCAMWAIMQLEDIGYAKMNWDHLFIDTSKRFSPIANAISITNINTINTKLYNFPICTIPREYQDYACKSISDWKNQYLDFCGDCRKRSECCGVFDWYDEKKGFEMMGAL